MRSSVGISSVWSVWYLILVFFYSWKSESKITSLLPNGNLTWLSKKWKGVLPSTLMDTTDQTERWFWQHLSQGKVFMNADVTACPVVLKAHTDGKLGVWYHAGYFFILFTYASATQKYRGKSSLVLPNYWYFLLYWTRSVMLLRTLAT